MSRRHLAADRPLPLSNQDVAEQLDQVADLLEVQGANPFRVRAYRTAAQTVRTLPQPAHAILANRGIEGLLELPGIGESLARTIEQLSHTGRLGLLERLRGHDEPERLLQTVAGIGPDLARRIHEELGIESLPELEASACDGRLATVSGMGPKRIRAVRESLAGRYRRRPALAAGSLPKPPVSQPHIGELLDIDKEYREKARAGRLPRIAPRRFNPTGEAWLPVLHARRGERHYTALFSNTARAHELGTIRDWVVICRDDRRGNGQWTAVTARFGKLRGKRIVRGRDQECEDFYQSASKPADKAHRPP